MAGDRNSRDFDRDDFDDQRSRGSSAGGGRYRGEPQTGGYGQQRAEQHSPGSFNHDPESSGIAGGALGGLAGRGSHGSSADWRGSDRGEQQGGYDRGYDDTARRGARSSGSQQGGYEDRSGYSGRNSSNYGTEERWTGDYGRPGSRGAGEFAGGGFGQRGDYTRSDTGSSINGGRDFGGRDYGARGYGQSGGNRGWSDENRSGDRGDRSSGWSGRSYGGSERGEAESGRSGDRGFWDKASDEVSSWFGDRDAESRRKQDEHRGRGPKSYSRSDDRIKEDVNDKLTDEGSLDASDIDVSVINQEVTLSGTVSSRNDKRRAEDVAETVSGVKHVQNNLRINSDARGGGSWRGGSSADLSTGATNWDRTGNASASSAGGSSSGSGTSTSGTSTSAGSSLGGGVSGGTGTGTGSSAGTTSATGSTVGTKSTT